MKSIKYITFSLSAAAMLFAGVGCQSDMDYQRDNRLENTQNVYERLSRVYEHVNSVFWAPVETGPQGFNADGYLMAGYCDEAQESAQQSSVANWYDGRVSSSAMPLWYGNGSDRWNALYSSIRNCNEGIEWLERNTPLADGKLGPDSYITDYKEVDRVALLAQFYAVRAYDYLLLIKRWGGVPILTTATDKGYDYAKDKRASFAQCVDFIIESCDKAMATNPSLTWFNGSSPYYPELCRAMLWAIKSQAALYAASPLWADDHAGTEPYTWERAATITKQALDLTLGHGGKLVDSATSFPEASNLGQNVYDKYFLASYPGSLAWDTETLYQPYNYSYRQMSVWANSGLPIDAGQRSSGACPTQEMVDSYEVVSADGSKSAPVLDLANPYNADGTPNISQAAKDLGYQDASDAMYANRDPRFYASIYYNGAKISLKTGEYEIQTQVNGNCGINLSPVKGRFTRTGYYLRKYNNPQSTAADGNKDGYMRAFRLAELYLNFAEAAYKHNGADAQLPATVVKEMVKVPGKDELEEQDVTYGTPMSAREAVNAVRARVGMPGIDDNGNAFWLRLGNERRVELAFEEHRFFDVRRWSAANADLSATDKRVSGMRIEENNGELVYTRFSFQRECYTNKYLKYPIGLSEIRKVLDITGQNWQNPGWN